MEINKEKMGDYLASLRKAKGISQQEVADYFYLSNKTVSKWETGLSIPDTAMLLGLAEYYNVTVDEILKGGKDKRNITPDSKVNNENERRKCIVSSKVSFLKLMLFITLGVVLGSFLIGLIAGYASTNGFLAGGLILGFEVPAVFAFLSFYFYTIEKNKEFKREINKELGDSLFNSFFLFIEIFCAGLLLVIFSMTASIRPSILDFSPFVFMILIVTFFLFCFYSSIREYPFIFKAKTVLTYGLFGFLLLGIWCFSVQYFDNDTYTYYSYATFHTNVISIFDLMGVGVFGLWEYILLVLSIGLLITSLVFHHKSRRKKYLSLIATLLPIISVFLIHNCLLAVIERYSLSVKLENSLEVISYNCANSAIVSSLIMYIITFVVTVICYILYIIRIRNRKVYEAAEIALQQEKALME